MKFWRQLLSVMLCLVIGIVIVVACDEEDDDTSSSDFTGSGDDDSASDDDSSDDDDDATGCLYEEEFTWIYNVCGTILTDENEDEMSLEDVIEECPGCVGNCGAGYMTDDDEGCSDFLICLDYCF